LKAGVVTLDAPVGWALSSLEQSVPAIKAGGSADVKFTLKAPSITGKTSVRPLLARFSSGDVISTPAAEMIWWGRE
jgi:hypothetical protein